MIHCPFTSKHRGREGFTIVELIVAMAITAIMLVMLVNITTTAGNAWISGDAKSDAFSGARGALDLISRDLQSVVADLDIGIALKRATPDEKNNFVLTFLKRKEPDAASGNISGSPDPDAPYTAVEKVSYQLAWASRKVDGSGNAQIADSYSANTPIPALLRSSSSDVKDIFNVKAAADVEKWTAWPTITANAAGDRTQVLADNVLGWRIEPIYLEGGVIDKDTFRMKAGQVKILTPDDDTIPAGPVIEGETPVVTTSKRAFTDYLLGPDAPVALRVRIAVIPSRDADRLAENRLWSSGWTKVRDMPELLDPVSTWPNDSFHRELKKSIRTFVMTIYLKSQTP